MSITCIDRGKYETGFAKLEQLEALIASVSGPGYEPFRALNKRLQENMIALAADLACDARRALTEP